MWSVVVLLLLVISLVVVVLLHIFTLLLLLLHLVLFFSLLHLFFLLLDLHVVILLVSFLFSSSRLAHLLIQILLHRRRHRHVSPTMLLTLPLPLPVPVPSFVLFVVLGCVDVLNPVLRRLHFRVVSSTVDDLSDRSALRDGVRPGWRREAPLEAHHGGPLDGGTVDKQTLATRTVGLLVVWRPLYLLAHHGHTRTAALFVDAFEFVLADVN
mmetsp:Transcript_46664/g.116272  ORF Transcript_46664/g.116272 Transcript_46664/m.116272 type:complete len:211 (-) Transcript_46664:1635-2267(-)